MFHQFVQNVLMQELVLAIKNVHPALLPKDALNPLLNVKKFLIIMLVALVALSAVTVVLEML